MLRIKRTYVPLATKSSCVYEETRHCQSTTSYFYVLQSVGTVGGGRTSVLFGTTLRPSMGLKEQILSEIESSDRNYPAHVIYAVH